MFYKLLFFNRFSCFAYLCFFLLFFEKRPEMPGNVLKYLVRGFFVLYAIGLQSQTSTLTPEDHEAKYLEDQFYIGFGYNALLKKPADVARQNFSYNIQAGFIRDIPLNTRRNFGLGLGLGYAANSYYSNLGAIKTNAAVRYEVLATDAFTRSKFETHALEIPIEIRWRTSTAEAYRFWRLYAGAKLGYVFSGKSRLVTDQGTTTFSNADLQKFQYGLILSFGYNTWNVHAYYGLNPLLKEGTFLENGAAIDLQVLRIGLIFYIL